MSMKFHDGGPAATGQKAFLATPVYENPSAAYTFSIQRSREFLHKAGIQTEYCLISGNCHIDDCRNSIVQEFLLSDCTDLVFLDADVSWEPRSLLTLCRYDCDIVGGVYPFRREDAGGALPVRLMLDRYEPDENGLVEVEGLPTGFMRIKRHVLEAMAKDAPAFWGKTDRRAPVPILFERCFENGDRFGGDIDFCRKWRALGGRVYAAAELRLGHVAKTIIRDSLGAWLRRRMEQTLPYVVGKLRSGETDLELFTELCAYRPNPFAAVEDVLALCALTARQAKGPIIEAGSGLTTIVMAAVTDQKVFCIEHDPMWAEYVAKLAREAEVTNIGLCFAPIRNGWYDLSEFPDLPAHFAVGLNDGPPRAFGSRMGFFDHFGHRCDTIICDDAGDPGYSESIQAWCGENNRRVDFVDSRAALIRPMSTEEKAA